MKGLLFLLLAQAPNPYLLEGRELAKAARFAEAIAQLKVARQVPDLDPAQRVEVLELLGRCEVAEGHRDEADAAYAELLGLEPDFELAPDTSPKVLELFEKVKQRLYPPPWLKLVSLPSAPGEAQARLVNPYHRVVQLSFLVRLDGGPWERRAVAAEGGVVRLPLEVEPGHALDWYLEADDEQGSAVTGLGSATQPQHVAVPAGAAVVGAGPTPRLKRVPAWVAVAVAVAAAGAGAAFQSLSAREARDAHDATHPPGDWADTARAAQGRAVSDATWATGLFVSAGVAGATGVVLFAW